MTQTSLTRRGLLEMAAAGSLSSALRAQTAPELVDFHAHIDAAPSLDELFGIARQRGVKFGVVEHAGNPNDHHYRGLIANNDDMDRYLARLAGKPCFKGIQAEGLDWMKCFSRRKLAQLDYVLTDALTFPEKDGTLVRLWTPGAGRITDKQDFMERYTAHHLRIIETEPIDILANPLFLPEQFQNEAESLWTDERTGRIIRAAVKNHVAFEINTRFRLPGLKFLRRAKASGAKFSFGSNIMGPGVGDLSYGGEVAKELGLQRTDLFRPAPAGRKPVQIRVFAS
jgi:histidinol phosphatase-like PHP family hydrolase